MEDYKTNAGQGLGLAGFILGLIAMLICFIPCFGILALVPGIIGITFSIIAYNQALKGNGARGFIIAAMVISILGSGISVLRGFVGFTGSHIMNRFEDRREIRVGDQDEAEDKDFDEEMDRAGDQLEKVLEKLENNGDSIHIDIRIGEKLSDSQFDKLMNDYEELIKKSRDLAKSRADNKQDAVLKYTQIAIKLTTIHARLLANMENLSPHQREKLKEINDKYHQDLENLKN